MSPEKIAFIVAVIFVIFSVLLLIIQRLPKRLKQEKFRKRWRELQKKCSDKEQWRHAVIEADDLLASALKKKRIKGGSMGERLVEAQKIFTDNDSVWFGHKLRTKLDANPEFDLQKEDVKRALMGIGQALKDLGALR